MGTRTLRSPEGTVVIGLTGGIATGKSTTLALLEKEAGAVVLNADNFGHQAYLPGTECFNKMVEHFGEKIVAQDGTVNRKALGPIVFSDPAQLQALNRIVWPAIRQLMSEEIFKQAEVLKSKGSENGALPVIVFEAAVLIEAQWTDLADEVWITTVSPEIAKERLMKRNNLSAEDAQKRINTQLSNEQRRKVAHVEVSNDGNEEDLFAQIRSKIDQLKARYARQSAFEFVDVVDEKTDQVVTHAKRAVVRSFNLVHRCTYVVLTHSKSQKIYVQRRSMEKDAGPGLLDPAPGGVVGAGESYEANARREMSEEMGLNNLQGLRLVCTFFSDGPVEGRSWGTVFTCETDVAPEALKLQADEVASVQLMTITEIMAMPESSFLPSSIVAFKKFIASS